MIINIIFTLGQLLIAGEENIIECLRLMAFMVLIWSTRMGSVDVDPYNIESSNEIN